MSIFDRIKQDHDTVRRLLDEAEKAGEKDGAKARRVYEDLQRELWAHGKVEEAVFYQALSKAKNTKEETVEGLNEHHIINGLLDELNAMPADGTAWKAKLQVLGEIVRHHLDEEEEELFEEAKEALNDKRADELGHLFAERKEQMLAALAPLPKSA
ncbi:hemerythrin domain-containing protein [Azospirillum sp. sgz302134]